MAHGHGGTGKRLVVITGESVWLVKTSGDGMSGWVEGRASFGNHLPTTHDYVGPIITGPDGLSIKVGGRLVFECQCEGIHVGWGSRNVTSGVITRVVEHTLRPARVVPEGYMDITPSWSAALRLLVEVREWKGLNDMALAADRYAAAVSLGLLTQGDMTLLQERSERPTQ